MTRKGGKFGARRGKLGAESAPAVRAVSILPMDIQIGDRFTDEEGEWAVVIHPAPRVYEAESRPGQPATERDVTWPAHVRVEIRRGTSQR